MQRKTVTVLTIVKLHMFAFYFFKKAFDYIRRENYQVDEGLEDHFHVKLLSPQGRKHLRNSCNEGQSIVEKPWVGLDVPH